MNASAPIRMMLVAICVATSYGVRAQPPHRSIRKSQPTPIGRAAPDTTATIPVDRLKGAKSAEPAKPAANSPPPYQTTVFDEGVPKAFDLPSAPRTRMRACGEKWQAIKMSGEAHSDTWRDFATKCLAEGGATKSLP